MAKKKTKEEMSIEKALDIRKRVREESKKFDKEYAKLKPSQKKKEVFVTKPTGHWEIPHMSLQSLLALIYILCFFGGIVLVTQEKLRFFGIILLIIAFITLSIAVQLKFKPMVWVKK